MEAAKRRVVSKFAGPCMAAEQRLQDICYARLMLHNAYLHVPTYLCKQHSKKETKQYDEQLTTPCIIYHSWILDVTAYFSGDFIRSKRLRDLFVLSALKQYASPFPLPERRQMNPCTREKASLERWEGRPVS